MAAAAILNFGKMSITLDWIKISCITLYGKMHHGHAEMTTWPLPKGPWILKTTYLIITKCLQEIRTTNEASWVVPWLTHSAAIFNFGEISITSDWINISATNLMRRCSTAMRRWPLDQKSKPEVNSRDVINESLKHMCVDLSDYNIYLNNIWCRMQIPHCQHAEIAKFT